MMRIDSISNNIMIDTQIWIYNKKVPLKERFDSDIDFQKAMEIHKKAIKFFKNLPKDTLIYFSTHQIAELFHTLAFRGLKIPLDQTNEFIKNLIHSKNIKIIPYSKENLQKAVDLSIQSKIHIWDYLCVISLLDYISKIYTLDIHFRDKTFNELGIIIENPLDIWQKI